MRRYIVVFVLLAACSSSSKTSSPTTTTTAPAASASIPAAIDILNGMKDGGASFDSPITDLNVTIDRNSEYEKFMQSKAATSSRGLDVQVEVWDTPEHRNAGRLFIIDADPSPLALIECGPAMLSVLANVAADGEAVRDELKPTMLAAFASRLGC
jgi:hypothetical protein